MSTTKQKSRQSRKRSIGERIADVRAKAGMTQQAVADQTGISPPLLSRYERGHKTPNSTTVLRLAECFGCTTDELLRD